MNNRNPQQNQKVKKNQMKILGLKNTIEILQTTDGFISRMRGTGERISELEGRTIELARSEQQRENRPKEI